MTGPFNPTPARPSDGICWVTGASSGIGEKLVERLVREGWRIAVSARSEDKLKALADAHPGQVFSAPADVSDPEAVKQAVARIEAEHGAIARAILNAGIYLPVDLPDARYEDYAKTFDVNLKGTAACLCAVLPLMAERRSGQIAFVSSATAFGGMPTASAYGASKAALVNMAEACRIELHRHGVLIQAVTPGFVDTPAQDDNAFPKPFMISADEAARRIVSGLKTKRFEITFPRRFTWMLKLIYALPREWHIALVRKQTGWDKPAEAPGSDQS